MIEENKENKIRKEKDDTQWENDSDFDYDADIPVNISDKQEDGSDRFFKDAIGVAFSNDTKASSIPSNSISDSSPSLSGETDKDDFDPYLFGCLTIKEL